MKARGTKLVAGLVAAAAVTMFASSTSAAPRPSATKPKMGGSVTYGIQSTVAGWCFSTALEGGPLGVTRMVYESLVDKDSKGNFVPQLAESWTPDATYKTWTFKLRPDIKYSNGEAFNAASVKQNIDIGRGLTTATDFSSKYNSTGIGVNANIESVEASDATTVKITLVKPDSDFISLMYRSARYVMRAPAQIKDSSTCASNGIGTGPFKIRSWTPTEVVLDRNPNYWRKDAWGQQLPYLDSITAVVVGEASQRAAALRKGTIDVGYFTAAESTFVKDLEFRKSTMTEYKSRPALWGQMMPNQNKTGSPFKYQDCRLAAAYAVDWNLYNKVRLKGLGEVSGSIVGKAHAFFTKNGATGYNLAKAKEYVAKCNTALGAAAPFKVTLYAGSNTSSINNTKFIQAQMEKAGILFNSPYIAESADIISKIYKAGGNSFDFAMSTPAEGPGAGYVMPFFMSNSFPADSTSPVAATAVGKIYGTIITLGNHSDTKLDGLVYAAKAASGAAAKTAWNEAVAYIQSTATAIPTVHTGVYTFVNKKSKLGGIGTLKNPDGKTLTPTQDIKGLEWTGIWKG